MRIIIITGQTATGKTQLALEYAQKYNGELINCDSRQIYKELDIITGKDIQKNSKFKVQSTKLNFDIGYYNFEKLTPKLWLYDIVSPNQYFSSFDYVQCVIPVIKNILKEGKTPIIIGGTYLYLYHLLYEVETTKIPPDWELRKSLEKTTINELQTKLHELNPALYNQLNHSDKNNPQRLIRKIEISKSNKVISSQNFNFSPKIELGKKIDFPEIQIEYIGLQNKNIHKLKINIIKRVDKRLQQGAIEEVKNILLKYSLNDPGLKTIGYAQIIQLLQNKITKKQAIEEWINKEMQYAKRQYTFMKRDSNIQWQ
ncbi:MAG: tRNA (adenosine(37)-N6)-dimethylallyltransferase MiaA [bacterium]|nr:tRNA (adenosine(37)-N6)-dimethylallyltransferase MiaA [bacterium]